MGKHVIIPLFLKLTIIKIPLTSSLLVVLDNFDTIKGSMVILHSTGFIHACINNQYLCKPEQGKDFKSIQILTKLSVSTYVDRLNPLNILLILFINIYFNRSVHLTLIAFRGILTKKNKIVCLTDKIKQGLTFHLSKTAVNWPGKTDNAFNVKNQIFFYYDMGKIVNIVIKIPYFYKRFKGFETIGKICGENLRNRHTLLTASGVDNSSHHQRKIICNIKDAKSVNV